MILLSLLLQSSGRLKWNWQSLKPTRLPLDGSCAIINWFFYRKRRTDRFTNCELIRTILFHRPHQPEQTTWTALKYLHVSHSSTGILCNSIRNYRVIADIFACHSLTEHSIGQSSSLPHKRVVLFICGQPLPSIACVWKWWIIDEITGKKERIANL